MQPSPLYLFFQQSGLFTPELATEVALQFTEKNLPRHEFLLREGKISNEYYIAASGCIRAFAINTEGQEITTAFYQPFQPVFEVDSFFNRTPSRENFQALVDTKGWYITFEQLNLLFHQLPQFREFGRSILVRGFSALKSRTLSMITETAEQRYATLLQTNPSIFEYAPLKHIASYLGVTDTSLSRIRKDFAKK